MRTFATIAANGLVLFAIESRFFIMKTSDVEAAPGGQAEECLWPFQKDQSKSAYDGAYALTASWATAVSWATATSWTLGS